MATAPDTPLTKWHCDVCGTPIEKVENGYVIWQGVSEPGQRYNFKIVHQRKCDDKSFSRSAALSDFLGPDGLTKLLAFLSVGPLKIAQEQSARVVGDLDELVDFIRRLQTPYYEEARLRFLDETVAQDYYDANEVGPYLQRTLHAIASGT